MRGAIVSGHPLGGDRVERVGGELPARILSLQGLRAFRRVSPSEVGSRFFRPCWALQNREIGAECSLLRPSNFICYFQRSSTRFSNFFPISDISSLPNQAFQLTRSSLSCFLSFSLPTLSARSIGVLFAPLGGLLGPFWFFGPLGVSCGPLGGLFRPVCVLWLVFAMPWAPGCAREVPKRPQERPPKPCRGRLEASKRPPNLQNQGF